MTLVSTATSLPGQMLDEYLATARAAVDRWLDQRLPTEQVAPATLHRAMRHSLFAGGKRLRPVLCLAAAEACGGSRENALPAAAAVECIHTFSLIHDDLPCMDDDDFRRGVPTCHKVFGDAVAVLAGDALQALAFEMVAAMPGNAACPAAAMVHELAQASGSLHLIGGQVLDLEGEGRDLSAPELQAIHERKTAALLATSVRLGAMSAAAGDQQLAALTRFGRTVGLAFQVIDDILDVTQSSETLGKSAGKDQAVGKATYPQVFGLERSREIAHQLTDEAHAALEPFGGDGAMLRAIGDYLLVREY